MTAAASPLTATTPASPKVAIRNSAWCATFSPRMQCAASEVRSLFSDCARAKALIRAGLAEIPGEVLVLTPDGEIVKRYFDGRATFGPQWTLESVGCPSCEGARVRLDCSTCGGLGFVDPSADAPASGAPICRPEPRTAKDCRSCGPCSSRSALPRGGAFRV